MEPGPPHGVPSDPPDRYGWEMSYFRFWPGGQVLEKPRFGKQPDRSIPTAAQADDFAGLSTGVGRYSLVGNRLTMALIGFDETGWHWYQRIARMNEDGSFTIPGAPARSPRDQNGIDRVFHRHTVERMKRFPDW